MKVIAFYNAKGGVGKTTSACAVAADLVVQHRFRVCCIDLDITQNSLSHVLLEDHDRYGDSVLDVLLGKRKFADTLHRSEVFQRKRGLGSPEDYHLYVCPCLPFEDESSLNLDSFPAGEQTLAQALPEDLDVDFVIIDCPPAMNALTKMALVASDGVLVPYRNDKFSLEGLTKMLGESAKVRQRANQDLSFLGVFFTQDNEKTRLSAQMKEMLAESLGENFIPVAIPQSVIASESTFESMPVNLYKPWSPIDMKYRQLTREILDRLGMASRRDLAAKAAEGGR